VAKNDGVSTLSDRSDPEESAADAAPSHRKNAFDPESSRSERLTPAPACNVVPAFSLSRVEGNKEHFYETLSIEKLRSTYLLGAAGDQEGLRLIFSISMFIGVMTERLG
jgi:hypothetical protein